MKRGLIAAACALGVLSVAPVAQADQAQLWISAGADVEPHRVFRLGAVQRLRIGSGVTEVLTDVSASVRATKWLRIAAGYRLGFEREDDADFEASHRLNLDAVFRVRLRRVRLRARARYQARVDDNPRHTLRMRFDARVRVKKWLRPYLLTETFFRTEDGPRKQRFAFGVVFPIQDHAIRLNYLLEVPLGDRNAERVHVGGLHYRYSF